LYIDHVHDIESASSRVEMNIKAMQTRVIRFRCARPDGGENKDCVFGVGYVHVLERGCRKLNVQNMLELSIGGLHSVDWLSPPLTGVYIN